MATTRRKPTKTLENLSRVFQSLYGFEAYIWHRHWSNPIAFSPRGYYVSTPFAEIHLGENAYDARESIRDLPARTVGRIREYRDRVSETRKVANER